MPAVNPALEELRAHEMQRLQKEQSSRREKYGRLVAECQQTGLLWTELSYAVQCRICRSVDTAAGQRCFTALAARLQVDGVDAQFYERQSRGSTVGPTELMLADVTSSRGRLLAALPLQTLLETSMLRCLADICQPVQEALAHRHQVTLLRRASSDDQCDDVADADGAESGYESSIYAEQSTGEIVGSVEGVADTTLLKATPLDERSADMSIDVKHKEEAEKTLTGTKLLLTYTADGREQAISVADQLKTNGFRVLLLEEQRRWQLPDRYTAVQKWFKQVDYVVPLLTAQYLAATQNRAAAGTEHQRRLAADARFVYSLMSAEMEANHHVNWRVRCLEPDGAPPEVRQHPLYGSPLFRWPFLVSELDQLMECLVGE